MDIESKGLKEFFYQALETEKGGVLVYEAAIKAAVNSDLKQEFEKYHKQTKEHVEIVEKLFQSFGLDPSLETPGSRRVKEKGLLLVKGIETALESGDPQSAQIVACENVVDAETKDHLHWELFAEVAKALEGEKRQALQEAIDKIKEEEDQHLYHIKGWTRELWIDVLGMPAVLPPPEDRKDVDSAISAAKAQQQRTRMLGGRRGGGKRGRVSKSEKSERSEA